MGSVDPLVRKVEVSAYRLPTDQPESDGTLEWDATTLVLVEISAGDTCGLGYTYADPATAALIRGKFGELIQGQDALAIPRLWQKMVRAIRNLGYPGICSMAIAAVDIALWDLKAKLLERPLVTLLGAVREGVPVYGSGGFTSYNLKKIQEQLGGWAKSGIPRVKMKIGREPRRDVERVKAARMAIGAETELFVDANGAYSRKQALDFAERFRELGVNWFEEPVSSSDLTGLRLLRDRAPAGMDIAAGEYGYSLVHFQRMLAAGAVDVLQAAASRCAGISGSMAAATVAQAFQLPFSAHCGPSLHVHPGCALANLRHLEYFHDHVRLEHMFFDGALTPKEGKLYPDLSRPGLGLEFKRADAQKYAIS